MVHPTRAQLDAEAVLASTQAGWYEGAMQLGHAPRWTVQLEGDRRDWRLSGEWRPAESGETRLPPRT